MRKWCALFKLSYFGPKNHYHAHFTDKESEVLPKLRGRRQDFTVNLRILIYTYKECLAPITLFFTFQLKALKTETDHLPL